MARIAKKFPKPNTPFRWISGLLLFSILGFLQPSLHAATTTRFPGLWERFKTEITHTLSELENPDRISGYDRFKLVYTARNISVDDQISRDLIVLKSQAELVDALIERRPNPELAPLRRPPGNQWFGQAGLFAAKSLMIFDCQSCETPLEHAEYRRAAKDLFKIFDLQDVHDGFSGLPFYHLVQERFSDPLFQKRVLAFTKTLEDFAGRFQTNPTLELKSNVFEVALEACAGDRRAAVEMLGILTSRDVLITRYLKYFNTQNPDFIKSFADAPLLVRLVADLDRRARGAEEDAFSVARADAALSTPRNYYYWSSALVADRLSEAGYSPKIIKEVVASLPKQYKTLRYLENFGPFKPAAWKKAMRDDTRHVMGISSAGADPVLKAAEQAVETESPAAPATQINAFIDTLKESPSLARQEKIEVLRAIATRAPSAKNRAYFLYYNVKSNLIGYPHLKLILDGTAYEIHRNPKSNGSYLRERPLVDSLIDARSGYLPTGILEMPITDEQIAIAKRFLEIETDASMRYSFFNKLLHSESYNCGGVLYDALKNAGVGPLPELPRNKVFPGQMLRYAHDSVENSKFTGKGDKWFHELQWPNWSLRSIPKPLKSRPSRPGQEIFGPKVGTEFVHAEQSLVTKIPAGADPINLLGKVWPYYSNNGALEKIYTPRESQILNMTVLLIPEAELPMLTKSASISSQAESIRLVSGSKPPVVRFFIHPNELKHYASLITQYPQDDVSWIATPSSSARSLLVSDKAGQISPFIIKSSLSVSMGGSQRLIDNERVARSVAVNDLMTEIHETSGGHLSDSGKSWDFFRESFAMLPPKPELGGYIFREVPTHMKEDIVLPLFALIADRFPEPRWIDELFLKSGKATMAEFVWEDIVKPELELHATMMENGLTSELHQQNTCFSVDRATRRIKGVVIRDMDGNWIDHSLRVHRLKKNPIRTGNFQEDAYLLRYALAPENHYNSYVDMLRERNIRNTFRFVLPPTELTELLQKSDAYLLGRFNKLFPDFKIEHISEYKDAWKRISASTITPEEQVIYNALHPSECVRNFGDLLRRIYDRRLATGLRKSR